MQARPDETGGADLLIIVGNDWGDLVATAKRPPDPNATTTIPPTTAAPAPADSTSTVAPPPTAPRSRSETLTVPVDPVTGGPLVGCP